MLLQYIGGEYVVHNYSDFCEFGENYDCSTCENFEAIFSCQKWAGFF